jgi:D-alanyl-D-alanine carboxypeptidase (penicillin-binding protein 5/6)
MKYKKYSFSVCISIVLVTSLIYMMPSSFAAKNSNDILRKKHQRIVATNQYPARYSRGIQILSQDPYSGAIVVDGATGRVISEDNPDIRRYPASMVKLMTFLIILEAIDARHISLLDTVTVSAEAERMGGSQVYLQEGEIFTVDDLLYALMVKSANDAAVALAIHYKGDKKEFVHLMNKRAQEIGMKDTVFHSVHGLPPGRGQLPDISTPRDMARLSRVVLRQPRALEYTSTRVRLFRTDAQEPFFMRNHNKLLGKVEGCDGLKTGYFRAAGYSIAATAQKNGKRVIAVVMGSVSQKVRNENAAKILSRGLMEIAGKQHSHDDAVAQARQGNPLAVSP